jgi:uncharacterized protein (DUF697 family)
MYLQEINMAKRKETAVFSLASHDTVPGAITPDVTRSPAGGEDNVPAAKVPANTPPAAPARDARPETSSSKFITRSRVEEIVKNRALLAVGVGLVPVPVLNLVSVAAIHISMVQSITRLYNIEVKKSWIKNVIASALGGLSATALSGTVAKGLGAAPLVGTSLAVLSAPAMNGLVTYAIGYMFIRYFESPEGLLKANAAALREWFQEGFKDGREKLGGIIAGKVRTA